MNRLSSLAAVSLLLAAGVFGAQTGTTDEAARERFVGSWRLVSLEEPVADGTVHSADCTGLLVFTRDGHMTVQVMYRDPQTGTAAGSVQYAQGGYEASFGRFTVDPRAGRFTYHVEGALVRSLVGKDLVRQFELSGKRLVVRSANANEQWRVTWERD